MSYTPIIYEGKELYYIDFEDDLYYYIVPYWINFRRLKFATECKLKILNDKRNTYNAAKLLIRCDILYKYNGINSNMVYQEELCKICSLYTDCYRTYFDFPNRRIKNEDYRLTPCVYFGSSQFITSCKSCTNILLNLSQEFVNLIIFIFNI